MKGVFFSILVALLAANSFCQSPDFHAADSLLNATFQTKYAGNVVCMVKQNDSLIYYKALGKYDSSSAALIASTSKTFSAAVILHLVSQGIISLGDSIGKYIPYASQFGHGDCTIQQCFLILPAGPFPIRRIHILKTRFSHCSKAPIRL
jgi:CubicO group peptidase (beta-lactamase class C family)